MSSVRRDPCHSPLLTDLYELTMACAYWKSGIHEREAVFHLVFRRHPFRGGFTVACGLAEAVDFLRDFRFSREELAYLAALTGNDGRPVFEREFLDLLGRIELVCDIDAVPEGTVVFPREPLVRVRGPIWQAQLLETALLNFVNFQTLIATKAARVCLAAAGRPVVEFGLRRAQGPNGGMAASRAAFVGGCAGTSNTLAGMRHGIPVMGTHAHSWVMAFDTEEEAFEAYAAAVPNLCVFLVDTYDTLEGVRAAVRVGRRLRESGHEMIGVRLDSGDLAWLSAQARRILDEGGFPDAKIVASNELDERVIESLREQGARIDTWGVGTRLATGGDEPALGGVYKLGAIREPGGAWSPRLKLSERLEKVSDPGVLQVRRFRRDGKFLADMLWNEPAPPPGAHGIVDPLDPTRTKELPADAEAEDLLVPVFRAGRLVREPESLDEIRRRARAQLASLDPAITRLLNPHEYPVGLEPSLQRLKLDLIAKARADVARASHPS